MPIYIYNTTNFLQQFLYFYNNNRKRKSRDDGAMVERQSQMKYKCCKFRNVICFLYEHFYYFLFFSGGYMCYFCPKVSDEIGILLHTIETHDACSTFSMRKSVFDEKIGCNAYRSLHFPVRISEIKSYYEKGFIFNINTETSRITFKRKHDDLNQNNPLDGHFCTYFQVMGP